MRSLLLASLAVLAASCSSSKCFPDCIAGYEPVPNACTCRPIQDAGGFDGAGGDRSIDDGPTKGDGGGTCDPVTLAAAIRTAAMQAGTPISCAAPLPPSDAAAADGARNATRAFLAATLAVPPEAFDVTAMPCGGEVGATCASHFNHDLYKSNGTLADALLPSSKDIESCAVYIEETIWTAVVNGVTGPAEVCISGVTPAGKLIGIAFFNDRASCP